MTTAITPMTIPLFTNGHSLPKMNGHHNSPKPQDLLAQLRDTYYTAGQSHVFTFYDSLSPPQQQALLAQLSTIDIHRVNRIYSNAVAADGAITPPVEVLHLDDTLAVGGNMIGRSRSPSPTPGREEVLPLPEEACASILNNPADEARWYNIGLQAVADNEVAVLLMAGGQGTRLGSSQPKGMYDINMPSGMVLFEYQAGRIKKLQSVAEKACGKAEGSVSIRWYVMTSGPTREETEKFFASKGYFGLRKENIIFFEQGTSHPSTMIHR
jgi:UDP-N-acetylglucosamine/UDP-N-acetylgalactosamine diphosphorylase